MHPYRTICIPRSIGLRQCEYDDSTAEFWVNTRTEGSIKREDLERLERKRSLEQDCDAHQALNSDMDFNMGGFPGDLGAPGPLELEGDASKSATCMHQSPNISHFPCSN